MLASAMNKEEPMCNTWRTPAQSRERHDVMVALRERLDEDGRPMTLKAISLELYEQFGRHLDHTTIIHHLKGRCTCAR